MTSVATKSGKDGGMRTFTVVWSGQLVSIIGSGLTSFALGVWVYLTTESVTSFALFFLFTTLPAVVISPFAGALVDRWDRRLAMILSDTGGALSTLTVAGLFIYGRIEIWHIYLAVAAIAIFNTLHWLAYSASITVLVPKDQLGRVNGMVQIGQAAQFLSPVVAGGLMLVVELQGVLLIDFATFLVALVTLLISRIPMPETTTPSSEEKGSLLREAVFGWSYIRVRTGLLALLILFATVNFLSEVSYVLFTPLILNFGSVALAGMILSIGGLGFLAGSLVMSAWGGPQRRIFGVLGFGLLFGLFLVITGLRPSVPFVTAGATMIFFCLPIIIASNQALWQSKVEPDLQGRVFAFRRMSVMVSQPFAYVIAGPLADNVFEPLIAEGGALAGSVGQILGVGTGRGIGLLYVCMGTLIMLAMVVAYLYPPLRQVEDELPDAVAVQPAA